MKNIAIMASLGLFSCAPVERHGLNASSGYVKWQSALDRLKISDFSEPPDLGQLLREAGLRGEGDLLKSVNFGSAYVLDLGKGYEIVFVVLEDSAVSSERASEMIAFLESRGENSQAVDKERKGGESEVATLDTMHSMSEVLICRASFLNADQVALDLSFL